MGKPLKQMLGERGAAKARRVLFSEYQKYLIDCLKSKKEAKQFEEWFQGLQEKGE